MYTDEILSKIKELQPSYLPSWKPDEKDAGWAVARTFASFLSGLEEQRDKLPEKLFIAYLDSLGFSQNPALAAKTPVTFFLTKNFKGSALIPKGTLLETKSKVNFETTESIMASAAKLVTLVDCDQRYVNNHAESLASNESFELFLKGNDNNDNDYIYYGDDVLFDLTEITVSSENLEYFGTTYGDENPKWRTFSNLHTSIQSKNLEYSGGINEAENPKWRSFINDRNTIVGDAARGNKVKDPISHPFANTTIKTTINGIESYWLRVKDTGDKPDSLECNKISASIDSLYYNNNPLPFPQSNEPIAPFGAIPQINDSFYISSYEVFSKKGGDVTIEFINDLPTDISWEYWNGNSWKNLTVNTNNLFTVPEDIHPTKVNGEENYWVRLRLLENKNYVKYKCEGTDHNKWVQDFTAPSLPSITLTLTLSTALADSTYIYQNPFKSGEKALYLAFDKPFGAGLFSMYIDMAESESALDQPLTWEYDSSDKNIWKDLEAKDGTNGFSQSGYCQFIAPSDQKGVERFGVFAYWLKVQFPESSSSLTKEQEIKGIYPNSVETKEGRTMDRMLLGSSDGSGSQKFMVNDTPLFDLKLWVLEPSLPENHEGHEDTLGDGYWVRWSQVERLGYASADERVFTIDSFSGEVRFGDDKEGKIPVLGKDNIVVNYRIGGGKRGNVLAGEVSKLVDTVAFVDKVNNPIDASGGSDLQSIENLMEMAPKRIKHRYRAVAREDYTYMVREASSDVAKVAVVKSEGGHLDLYIVPFSKQRKPMPSLGLKKTVQEHIDCVSPATATVQVKEPNYVALNLTLELSLVNFSFVSTMKNSINEALKRFLHPIDGNHHGEGWEFGVLPSLANFYGLFDEIEGITLINTLEVKLSDSQTGDYALNDQSMPILPKDMLICNGTHNITLNTEVQNESCHT